MNKCDEVLHSASLICMEKECELFEEEMEKYGEHVFSDEFNRKMDQLFADIDRDIARAKKRKKRKAVIRKFAPVAVIIVFAVVGLVVSINFTELNASNPSISITSWCKEFFSFTGEKDDNTEVFTFDEARIGYIPEGFKKTEEDITASYVLFKYENGTGDYIFIKADYDDAVTNINNENIVQDLRVNEDGIEYRFIENKDHKELNIIFKGKNKLYYLIAGNVSEEEMINIMNGIDQ